MPQIQQMMRFAVASHEGFYVALMIDSLAITIVCLRLPLDLRTAADPKFSVVWRRLPGMNYDPEWDLIYYLDDELYVQDFEED